MKQAQLLTFGLKVFYNSTFIEVHKQLEPLWRNFAKRKHEIQFTSKSVAELLVYEQQTQLLILRLENSRLLFSKQISSLNKQANDKANNKSIKLSMERSRLLKDAISALKKGNKARSLQLQEFFESLPNILHHSVPEEKPQIVRTAFLNFCRSALKSKDHVEIGANLDLFDLQTASNVSGHRFVYLKGDGALLANALEAWTINFLMKQGFLLMSTPDVIKDDVLAGCGFRPDGPASQVYKVSHGKNQGISLAGTGEIPLVGYYANKDLENELKYSNILVCAASNCYRAEAGDRGRKIRGLYRLHQFRKIEMVCITRPERKESDRAFKELVNLQETIYKYLKLPYRVVNIPVDDLGDVASRKIDIEVHMPGMNMFGEVTSASECLSYQSSRLNIRCGSSFAYTLNATAVAIPRTLIAIIENYQTPEGTVIVPNTLRPYMPYSNISPKLSSCSEVLAQKFSHTPHSDFKSTHNSITQDYF